MIVFTILCILVQVYLLVLILHVIFSFVPRPPEPIMPLVRGVRALTDPVLVPLRRLVPPLRTGAVAFDLSILIVFFAISFILQPLLCR